MRTTLEHQKKFKRKKKALCMSSNPFFFSPSHENSPHKKNTKGKQSRASNQVSEQASMWKDTEYKSTPICESKQASRPE
jgi:hypothetical protein